MLWQARFKGPDIGKILLKVAGIILLLYIFLVSIGLMESSFRLFGEDTAQKLFALASNRFVGLFIGILTTALVQSSSFTTSLTVGLVGSGMLTIGMAVPIVMGANVGTSVTNILVAHGHIGRREEFKRATQGAMVHDFFNLLAVAILFPFEMMFGFLEGAARFATDQFGGSSGATFTSPVKAAIKPVVHLISTSIENLPHVPQTFQAILVFLLALLILFFSLFFIVKVLKSLVLEKIESFFSTYIFRTAGLSFLMGLLFTATVQSSSVTTSLIVPMAAAGVLTLEQIFPYTLGANIGTTVTALLASLATISVGNLGGVTVAFAHLLFNIFGILIIYPMRFIPIGLAREIGARSAENRLTPFLYVVIIFFYVPGLCIYLSEFGLTVVGMLLLAGLPALMIAFSRISRALQKRRKEILE
jgi:sodium-dependent phosphate cotransporter